MRRIGARWIAGGGNRRSHCRFEPRAFFRHVLARQARAFERRDFLAANGDARDSARGGGLVRIIYRGVGQNVPCNIAGTAEFRVFDRIELERAARRIGDPPDRGGGLRLRQGRVSGDSERLEYREEEKGG